MVYGISVNYQFAAGISDDTSAVVENNGVSRAACSSRGSDEEEELLIIRRDNCWATLRYLVVCGAEDVHSTSRVRICPLVISTVTGDRRGG